MDKIKVNWNTNNEAWAFRYLSEHVQKALPNIEHSETRKDADIQMVMSTHQFKHIKPGPNVILHLDSIRSLR